MLWPREAFEQVLSDSWVNPTVPVSNIWSGLGMAAGCGPQRVTHSQKVQLYTAVKVNSYTL